MARQDLVGLLTGVQSTQQPISATNPQDWRMQFGQRQSEKMNQRLRGLTGRMSTQEALGAGLSQLDLSTPEGLRTVAKLQQATGDLAGAAQTASRIQTMAAAKTQEDRAERGLQIREEQLAMQKTAAGEAKEREDALLAQSGVSRALFAEQARNNGMENLAVAIETNSITLERAGSLLYGTSNAVIKAPTADEEKAFDRILKSDKFQKKVKGLEEREFTNWLWFVEDISDETKQAIYFKAKELMTRQKMSTEEALEQAITSIKLLDQIPEGSGKSNDDSWREKQRTKTRKEQRSKRPVDEMLKDDSSFATITEMN
jgi:hypothetical protein